MNKFFLISFLVLALTACNQNNYVQQLKPEEWDNALKLGKQARNPLIDFNFTADPTAVEYEGRLYVYGTNDHQQFEEYGPRGRNRYEKIQSLTMCSTVDMVNWTWHGLIPTREICPFIVASWAPSIVSRVEDDGLTHFYLYFSNSGFGTGVITATSPVGPWTSPLDHSLVDAEWESLGECETPFDPGVVIDENGDAWIAFGAESSRFAKLGKDMVSFASDILTLPAPFHFEANEMNYIDGTYVYTYNMDWTPHQPWTLTDQVPGRSSMAYMTTKTPLDPTSWKFEHDYFKTPAEHHLEGLPGSNNHTHLHQYKGKWYLFYQTADLMKYFNTRGGFRNISVNEITVEGTNIHPCTITREGAAQIEPLNPYEIQQIETTAGTNNVKYVAAGKPGNMILECGDKTSTILLKGVSFSRGCRKFIPHLKGNGTIEVYAGTPDGELICGADVSADDWKDVVLKVQNRPEELSDICILCKGEGLEIDYWTFK